MKYLWGLLLLLGMALLVEGTTRAARQHRDLSGLSVVQATILTTDIKRVGRSDYTPAITFEYVVSGKTYQSDRVYAAPPARAKRWAQRIASRFPAGSEAEAWYKPDDPPKAVLLPYYTFSPYGMVLTAMAMLIGGAWMLVKEIRGRPGIQTPDLLPDGWCRLSLPMPHSTIGSRQLLGALAWQATGVLGCGHYFFVANDPVNRFSMTGVVVWSIIGAVILAIGIFHLWISRWVAPTAVFTNRSIAITGQGIRVRVEQLLLRNAEVAELEVKLVCAQSIRVWVGKDPRMQTTELYSDARTAYQGRRVAAGETLTADVEFEIPLELPSSKPTRSFSLPRIDWEIQTNTKVKGGPACRHSYLLCVQSAKPRDDDATPQRVAAADHVLDTGALRRGVRYAVVEHGTPYQGTDGNWHYSTSLRNIGSERIRVVRFAAFTKRLWRWRLSTFKGTFFSDEEFRDWYGMGTSEWLAPDEAAEDPNNYGPPPVIWAYFCETESGDRFVTGAKLP